MSKFTRKPAKETAGAPRALGDQSGAIHHADLNALFAAGDSHPYGLILKLVFASGRRFEEVARLRVSDLDAQGHPRGLLPFGTLTSDVRYALLRLADGREPGHYLFAVRGDSASPPAEKTVSRFLHRISAKANVEGVTLKVLRDNFALYGLTNGMDPSLLMRQMSYKSGKTMHRLRRMAQANRMGFPSPLDMLEKGSA